MAKFKVAITLTETQVFTIEANNSAEAVEKISDAYKGKVTTIPAARKEVNVA